MTRHTPREREHVDPAGGREPSNTRPSNTRVVASGVDTLYLGFRGSLRRDVLAQLEAKRELLLSRTDAAKAAWKAEQAETDFALGETRFVLRPCSGNGYRFRLFNADVAVMLHPNPPTNVAAVRAQLSAAMLWREGWRRAVQLVTAFATELLEPPGEPVPPIVSRLDLCADFQGWIPTEADAPRFVTRASSRAAYTECGNFTGFGFGRGDIVARIYNKTAEIVRSGKEWTRAIWELNGYDPRALVWRLEFQIRREVLREFGVDTARDLPTRVGGLWRHLSNEWLRLALPTQSKRRERWPADPSWRVLALVAFDSIGGDVMRDRKRSADIERIERQLLGCVASFAARESATTLDCALEQLRRRLHSRLARSGVQFSDLVDVRQRRLQIVSPCGP
jgi:hypothetical protein